MDQCTDLKIGSKTVADLYKVSLPTEMTLNEIVPIFMKMMVLEVSFLQGYSLIESTHNCVLLWPESWASLENDSSLTGRILLAYGKSNLKTLARWISFMTTSEVYEGNGDMTLVVSDMGYFYLCTYLFIIVAR